MKIDRVTLADVMAPIGPYCHMTIADSAIFISAIAGVDPATGELVGPDTYSQTRQILASFAKLLASVGAELEQVTLVRVFLRNMEGFEEMNRAFIEFGGKSPGKFCPARTVIGVSALPKTDALLTMDLCAVLSDFKV